MMIKPNQKPIVMDGSMSYLESVKAYATMRLKRKIIDLFPQLSKNENWRFKLEYPQTREQAIERIKELEEIPFILWIYKGENNGRRTETKN